MIIHDKSDTIECYEQITTTFDEINFLGSSGTNHDSLLRNTTYTRPLRLHFNQYFIQDSKTIHEQNTTEIIAVKKSSSLHVIKHTWIFTKLLLRISRLIQHLY